MYIFIHINLNNDLIELFRLTYFSPVLHSYRNYLANIYVFQSQQYEH